MAGHKQTLAPGKSVTTPKAFVGLYQDDLDNAGNECLDWQYRYMWDYTRDGWFPAIRMQGFWNNGTTWGSNWSGGGAVGILRNYYASLLFPPDKTSDIPEATPPDGYDKATYRGKLCINFDMYGDTWNPEKLEGIRGIIDIYHYLLKHGVVGRWVKAYRPVIIGDDPPIYFQRQSRDRKRGIIIPKRPAPGSVMIKPKGLLKKRATSFPSIHESDAAEKRTGADLMEQGISLQKMIPGELIYLNLPLHPGSKLDTKPPSPPNKVTKRWGENMGYPGVEIAWGAGKDNNWISYYEVFRNGLLIDKLAKGTF